MKNFTFSALRSSQCLHLYVVLGAGTVACDLMVLVKESIYWVVDSLLKFNKGENNFNGTVELYTIVHLIIEHECVLLGRVIIWDNAFHLTVIYY